MANSVLFKFRSLTNKQFNREQELEINRILSNVYDIYPYKIVNNLNVKFKSHISELKRVVKDTGYDNFRDFFEDFGFDYADDDSKLEIDYKKIKSVEDSSCIHFDNTKFDYVQSLIFKNDKIYLRKDKSKYIYDQDIEVLNLPLDIYTKLKKVSFFNKVSNLLYSRDDVIYYYGMDSKEKNILVNALNEFLNSSFNNYPSKDKDIKKVSQEKTIDETNKVKKSKKPIVSNCLDEKIEQSENNGLKRENKEKIYSKKVCGNKHFDECKSKIFNSIMDSQNLFVQQFNLDDGVIVFKDNRKVVDVPIYILNLDPLFEIKLIRNNINMLSDILFHSDVYYLTDLRFSQDDVNRMREYIISYIDKYGFKVKNKDYFSRRDFVIDYYKILLEGKEIRDINLSAIISNYKVIENLNENNIYLLSDLLKIPMAELCNLENINNKYLILIHEDINEYISESLSENSIKECSILNQDGKKFNDAPIVVLNISNAVYESLKKNKINMISDILKSKISDLAKIKSFSKTKAKDLKLAVLDYVNIFGYENERTDFFNLNVKLNGDKICFEDDKAVYDIDISIFTFSSKVKANLYINNIHLLSDLLTVPQEVLYRIKSFSYDKINAIKKEVNTYILNHIFINDEEHNLLECKGSILDLIQETHFDGANEDQIVDSLKDKYIENDVKKCINELLESGKIFLYEDNKLFYQYPTFAQYLYPMEKSDLKDMLYSKINGSTLEEIAGNYGVTRERIRQIIKHYFDKNIINDDGTSKIYFKEDRFKYIYETYEFSREEFLTIFKVKERSYNYLTLRYNKGKKSFKDALEDKKIFPRLRSCIQKYVDRNAIFIDGIKFEKKSLKDIVRYYGSKHCNDSMKNIDFYNNACEYIKNLVGEDAKIPSFRGCLNTWLGNDNNFICTEGSFVRYYNFEEKDFTELLETLNLDSYSNIMLSTKLFVDKYPELMKKYDIRDEYELHAILKYIYFLNNDNTVTFKRMPTIVIGNFDKKSFVETILSENSPIIAAKLGKILNEITGIDIRQFFCPSWTDCISEYKVGNQYIYDYEPNPLTQEEFDYLKKSIVNDFYFIDEIKDMYAAKFGNDTSKIDIPNLTQLGLKVFANYCLKNGETSTHYFESVLSQDIIKYVDYKKYLGISMFDEIHYSYMCKSKVIKFSKNGDLISIKKLNDIGITMDDLKQYCDEVKASVREDEYFSISSLKDKGIESSLYDLGFEDIFYEQILKYVGGIDSFIIDYKNVMNLTSSKCNSQSFLREILNEKQIIESSDLLEYLNDEFEMKTNKEKIKELIKDTEMYYNVIMDTFYKDYKTYYEEI